MKRAAVVVYLLFFLLNSEAQRSNTDSIKPFDSPDTAVQDLSKLIGKKFVLSDFINSLYQNPDTVKKGAQNSYFIIKSFPLDTAKIAPSPIQSNGKEFSRLNKFIDFGIQLTTLYQLPIFQNHNNVSNDTVPYNPEKGQTVVLIDLPVHIALWKNANINITAEYTGGGALGGAMGMGAYVNGIYGSSKNAPYILKAQFSQKLEFGKDRYLKDAQITLGQFLIQDMLNANSYCGDPTRDFLNLSHIFPSAWDAPCNAFGFTYGAALRLNVKGGQFNFAATTVIKEAGGLKFDFNIKNAHGFTGQYAHHFNFLGKSGTLRLSGFINKVFCGRFSDYVLDTIQSRTYIPDSLKNYNIKYGFAGDLDFKLNDNGGLFLKYSWNNGKTESMHYTEVDRSLCFGMVYHITKAKKTEGFIGLAGSINGLSKEHANFIAMGGTGFMLNDGYIKYKDEIALEIFYNIKMLKYANLGINYQHIFNPGYNQARRSSGFVGVRLMVEI